MKTITFRAVPKYSPESYGVLEDLVRVLAGDGLTLDEAVARLQIEEDDVKEFLTDLLYLVSRRVVRVRLDASTATLDRTIATSKASGQLSSDLLEWL